MMAPDGWGGWSVGSVGDGDEDERCKGSLTLLLHNAIRTYINLSFASPVPQFDLTPPPQ